MTMRIHKAYLSIIIIIPLLFTSCKNENKVIAESPIKGSITSPVPLDLPDTDAGTIVKRAIDVAGGWENWTQKKTLSYIKKIQIFDSLGNRQKEVNQLHQYLLRPTFKAFITWEEEADSHQIINNGKQAWKLKNGELKTDETSVNSAWNSSFGSHYMICMPFKLSDPKAILNNEGIDTLATNKIVYSVKVDYEKGAGSAGGMHTWWFYFNKDSHLLAGNFLDHGNGESYTQYETFTEVDGIKISHIRKSYKSNANRDLLYLSTIYTNEDIQFNLDLDKSLFELKK